MYTPTMLYRNVEEELAHDISDFSSCSSRPLAQRVVQKFSL